MIERRFKWLMPCPIVPQHNRPQKNYQADEQWQSCGLGVIDFRLCLKFMNYIGTNSKVLATGHENMSTRLKDFAIEDELARGTSIQYRDGGLEIA